MVIFLKLNQSIIIIIADNLCYIYVIWLREYCNFNFSKLCFQNLHITNYGIIVITVKTLITFPCSAWVRCSSKITLDS